MITGNKEKGIKMKANKNQIKKTFKTILQLTICGCISSLVMSFDLLPHALLTLGGALVVMSIAVGILNLIYDDEMRVKLFRKDSNARGNGCPRLAHTRQ